MHPELKMLIERPERDAHDHASDRAGDRQAEQVMDNCAPMNPSDALLESLAIAWAELLVADFHRRHAPSVDVALRRPALRAVSA